MMKSVPLANLLRPSNINDVIGQEHLTGVGKPFNKMVLTGKCQSTVLWGPPGVGKTSIVRALAAQTNSTFRQLNATEASIKDVRAIIEKARTAENNTFLFVDECHRWNKAQQDSLLPNIEDGTIIFFGATTENPKFAVNSTILSRCVVLELKSLNDVSAVTLIKKVIQFYKSNNRQIKIDKDAAKKLINLCSGDARKIITVLETCIEILSDDDHVTVAHIDMAIPTKHIVFDARGNDHYDLAHAYQEAIQHSDVDGALYWLSKWLQSGEDPAYISRRMLITAFEDCAGNPSAWLAAMAASYAVERTGMPECRIPLSLATCEMAKSVRNKSAYNAIDLAMNDVNTKPIINVPAEMRAGTHGNTKVVNQVYLPKWVKDSEVNSIDKSLMESNVYFIKNANNACVAGPMPDLDELLKLYPGEDGDCVYIGSDRSSDVKLVGTYNNGWSFD